MYIGVPSSGVSAYIDMCLAPEYAAVSIVFIKSSGVWFFKPNITSTLKLQPFNNLAHSRKSFKLCILPRSASWESTAVCKPTEKRFMPHFKYVSILFLLTVPGFISIVISAPFSSLKYLRAAATISAI